MTTYVCRYCEELRVADKYFFDYPKEYCEYCKAEYEWSYRASSLYYYNKANGQIEAKVTVKGFSDSICRAEINDVSIGNFISETHAKTAVENHIKCINMTRASELGLDLMKARLWHEKFQRELSK